MSLTIHLVTAVATGCNGMFDFPCLEGGSSEGIVNHVYARRAEWTS